ncbi:MAG: hypothetical protein ACRD2C_24950 [Acidimicrobiales bacterium]
MPTFDLPEETGVGELLGDELTSRLDRWVADARVEDAARRRSSERWLRQQAEEEGTFSGVLLDLAERGAFVSVHVGTGVGRVHRGMITLVGQDFVRIEVPGAGAVLIASRVISSVRADRDETVVTGDRTAASRLTLAEMIIGLAADRERALFLPLDGRAPVCGSVRSVGHDLVVVRLDAGGAAPSGTAYLPLAQIGEVVPGL